MDNQGRLRESECEHDPLRHCGVSRYYGLCNSNRAHVLNSSTNLMHVYRFRHYAR
jgi:hypothetical protein